MSGERVRLGSMTGTPGEGEVRHWLQAGFGPRLSELPVFLDYEVRMSRTLVSATLQLCRKQLHASEEACTLIDQCQEVNDRCMHVVEDMREFLGPWLLSEGDAPGDVQETLDRVLRFTRLQWERSARLEREDMARLPGLAVPNGPLGRVFLGLVLNALAAMRPEPSQRPVLSIRSWREPGHLRVTVSTPGPGLPAEVRPHLFDPLCPPVFPGSGQWMGLYSLQVLVERMGGALWVDHPPGLGVLFHVRLPENARIHPGAPQPPLEEPQLRALEDNERDTMRAVVACASSELLHLQRALRSRLKRLRGLLEEQEDGQRGRRLILRLFKSVRRLHGRVQELRHLRHAPPWPPRPLPADGCLAEALRILGGELARTARLEMDFAPGLPPVYGSEGHLRQVFLHLLRTSLRAMQLSTPRAHLLRVRTWREEGWVCVSLADTSDGISADKLPSLLDGVSMPYGQSGAFDTYRLPISHALIQAMGGALRIDSQEGAGTTYGVRLPINGVAPGRPLR